MPEVYEPAEDSLLLSEVIKKEIPKLLKIIPTAKILEVGSGSGFQLEIISSLGVSSNDLFSLDINPDSVKKCI